MLVSLSAFSADLGLLGCEPPTTVNWAPRRIALGSKFDIESSSSCREPMQIEWMKLLVGCSLAWFPNRYSTR